MCVSGTHSTTALNVLIKLHLAAGGVEEPAAVQLVLQVVFGFVVQHPPGGLQQRFLNITHTHTPAAET